MTSNKVRSSNDVNGIRIKSKQLFSITIFHYTMNENMHRSDSNIPAYFSGLFFSTESMKVKKTDLPVMPSDGDQDILPSFDDETDGIQDDDEDDDDMDDDEDMMADEAVDSDDDDYDEDIDESQQEDEDTWNNLSTTQSKAKESTTVASTTQRTTEATTVGSSASAIVDPYFTHFDPRSEHQSYKVKVSNAYAFKDLIMLIEKGIFITGRSGAFGGNASREGYTRHEGLVRFGGEIPGHAIGRPEGRPRLQATHDGPFPGTFECL